jgi:hypothetical protein
MSPEAFEKRPYLDWSLDRWKTGVILLVFGGLVISSLAGPAADLADAPIGLRAAPTVVATARVLAGTDAPQSQVAPAVTTKPSADAASPAAALPGALISESIAALTPTVVMPVTSVPQSSSAEATTAASPTPASAGLVFPLTLANVSPNAIVAATASAPSMARLRQGAWWRYATK